MSRIAVLDHGSGNLHSVSRVLGVAGATATVTDDAADLARADALVIPGVGHFGACMRALTAKGLDAAVKDFVGTGRPVLGVCLGMQVLFEASEEDGAGGLGIIPGAASRLPDTVTVPHMGWNTVSWSAAHPYTAGIPDGAWFYFVHSYAVDVGGSTVGVAEHGRPFAAAVAHANVFATQFHPEKSAEAGLRLYANFVREVGRA
jgi:glutamine amidotransferase